MDQPMEYQRLLPAPAETATAADLLAQVRECGSGAPVERPYVLVNFIASADGRATVAGRSGGLGDEGDRAMFHGLREQADAVLAGTGTLVTERYGRILGKAERRERREQRGAPAEPLACVITRTGAAPLDIPLFDCPEARVVLFTSTEPDLEGVRAQLEVVHLERGEFTLTTVMRRLRSDFGVTLLLCEGGPTLFSGLLGEGLVDELFLTLAPKLAGGGSGPAITTGAELVEPAPLELVWLLERAGSLYLRYRLRQVEPAA